MSKSLKKQTTPLKFDTSSANINCFILSKSKEKAKLSPSTLRRNKLKLKNVASQKPQIQFQEKVFLSSVVSKVLNQVDFQGIPELIEEMVFPVGTSNELELVRNSPLEELEQEEIRQIFRDTSSCNKRRYPTKDHSYDAKSQGQYQYYQREEMYHYPKLYQREGKQECTTTNHSSLGNQMSPRLQEKEENLSTEMIQAMNQVFAMGYPYQFYPQTQNNLTYHKIPHRKRRSATDDQLHEFKIIPKEIQIDGRTTLMIRHIPNKYSQDLLLQQIDKNYKMKINFLYLPIDNYNSCNVGYAFVNFIHAKFILEFYNEFNGRRWDRFNSEKICQLAYARIQGTTSLMNHFQNTTGGQIRGRTLQNEEKPNRSKQLNETAQNISGRIEKV